MVRRVRSRIAFASGRNSSRSATIPITPSLRYSYTAVEIGFRAKKLGAEIKIKRQQLVRPQDLVVAEIDAKLGGFGVVPPELAGAIVSSHYFVYEIDTTVALPEYLDWYLRSGVPERAIQPYVKGSTNYAAIRGHHFLLLHIPLPSTGKQRKLVDELAEAAKVVSELVQKQRDALELIEAVLPASLHGLYAVEAAGDPAKVPQHEPLAMSSRRNLFQALS